MIRGADAQRQAVDADALVDVSPRTLAHAWNLAKALPGNSEEVVNVRRLIKFMVGLMTPPEGLDAVQVDIKG